MQSITLQSQSIRPEASMYPCPSIFQYILAVVKKISIKSFQLLIFMIKTGKLSIM